MCEGLNLVLLLVKNCYYTFTALSKSTFGFLIKLSLIYSCKCRKGSQKEQDTRNNQKRIACISSRTFGWRRRLFGVERRSKKSKITKRWYSYSKKVRRPFERSN